jgi:transposase
LLAGWSGYSCPAFDRQYDNSAGPLEDRNRESVGARLLGAAIGASVLYLPSYSPDLNPIEQFFSKLKALLRKAAERTIPDVWRRIRLLIRKVCPQECANFFRHAGYAST